MQRHNMSASLRGASLRMCMETASDGTYCSSCMLADSGLVINGMVHASRALLTTGKPKLT